MEFKPLLPQLTDPNPRCESQMGTDCFDFEFPTAISSSAIPNDVVFCGKVISRETQPGGKNKNPFIQKPESFSSRFHRVANSVRSGSNGENRWRMPESQSKNRKHWNGLFGIVKFPLQMELSDIKMRQERKMTLLLPLPKPAAEDESGSVGDGRRGKSCLDVVRPLGQRSWLLKALAKATFGRCIRIV